MTMNKRGQSFRAPGFNAALLTHFRHLRHRSYEGSVWKLRCVVVDVLYFNYEFRHGLKGLLRVAVQSLCVQDIMCFLLPIQALGGMNITSHLVDDEYRPGSLSAQNVSDGSVTFIWVWVKLDGGGRNKKADECGGREVATSSIILITVKTEMLQKFSYPP